MDDAGSLETGASERPETQSGGRLGLRQADPFDHLEPFDVLEGRLASPDAPPFTVSSRSQHTRIPTIDGLELLAGVDEAGRGPLAGPVCAAAVILMPENLPATLFTGADADQDQTAQNTPQGITDSKRLSAGRREALFEQIQSQAAAWSIAWASVAEIDQLNILQASLLAMRRALLALPLQPSLALIDGNRCPEQLPCPARAIVGGDGRDLSIGAASILAKVARDREMTRLDRLHPAFGFAQHKGYPSKAHLEALDRLGPSIHHRRSFSPVRQRLNRP